MTMFDQPVLPGDAKKPSKASGKPPVRWSLSNWAVRWKVLAIVAIPVVLALAFGGLRVYNSLTDARDLRRAADRAELVGPIEDYTAALEGALLAYSTGTDAPVARKVFDDARFQLQRKLSVTDVDSDVRSGITTLVNGGPALLDKVASNSIGLRDTVTSYAPILLTAEDAIIGSVRVDDEGIRAEAQGLSRAVGARGQMLMQKLLVNRGGELPEPELRTSMITLAGTEPSTLFGMNQVLGVGSPAAKTLRDQMVIRMAIVSDPAAVLAGNADILRSVQTTDDIAKTVITNTTASLTSAVDKQASTARTAAIRDSAIALAAFLVALLLVLVVARSLVRPLRRLRDGALRVAHEDLPAEIDRVSAGESPAAIQPIPVHTTEEIGQVAHAVDDLHEQALLMAAEQTRLQLHITDMFETLSRRSRSLVDAQVTLIDDLERHEDDPKRLEALFKLDHLAARMGRNGTNLLVLAGSKVRREQTQAMPVGAIINAAASQVEDYQRVKTSTVPHSSVVGSAAGDIVHLLAELIDNALRYSRPGSQVRISAVHTGSRGLVIEVSDAGLGMTEGDLRMANMRLESGGEVTPYSTRHMGLFVVGRLAQQHGLVVRLRSSLAGEPGSGTTAGIFIPARLIDRGEVPGWPEDEHPQVATPSAFDATPEPATLHSDAGLFGQPYRNGLPHEDESAVSDLDEEQQTVLPRRDPGTSGIVGVPEIPDIPEEPPAEAEPRTPIDTSAFFSSREHVAEPQAPESAPSEQPAKPARTRPPSSPLGDTDVIFQRMVSEWLVEPKEIMGPIQSWESVWDSGWAAAAQAENAPVAEHTDQGLPMREPGARLVPGSADTVARPNGAHRKADGENGAGEPATRDPEAVRASLSSHWGGVRAGRSHAREDGPGDDRE
jgi:signal transduction histidine kinase